MTILLTATLSLANMQHVEVNYLFGQFRMPLILLILLSVLLGFLIQLLISLPKGFAQRHQLNQLKKQLQASQERLDKSNTTNNQPTDN